MQHILINLSIIAKIKPNDKIYINSENYIQLETDSIIQGIIRFLYNNSRAKNISNLSNFYNSVFGHVTDLINSKYLNLYSTNNELLINICDTENEQFTNVYNELNEIKHYISSSINGLDNLKQTYVSDILTVAKIDIIISNIETNVNKIANKLVNLKTHKKEYKQQ